MNLRVDIRPYFPKIAEYYWEELPAETPHLTIWDWLKRDYSVIRVGPVGSQPELWVRFSDEKMLSWFVLRWV